ncbi:hypothetical protein evm_008571 [Chilo suppressalis]|nr:hypothetical protein evm_008571 [Chilo suppressalis]
MEPATEGSDATATANAATTAKSNATTTATVNATTTATVNAAKTATATSSGGKRRDQSDTVKVIVTGYPQYSQPQDLVRIFSKFGEVKVDKLTPKFAILSYTNRDAALEAVQASKRVNVYGEFLIVKLHNEKMAAELAKSSPKKDFPRTKQKGTIIEPAQIDLSGSFPQQLERLLAAVRLTQEEVTALTALYTDVENALRPHYAGCSAVPFGSITTGLGVQSHRRDASCCCRRTTALPTPTTSTRPGGCWSCIPSLLLSPLLGQALPWMEYGDRSHWLTTRAQWRIVFRAEDPIYTGRGRPPISEILSHPRPELTVISPSRLPRSAKTATNCFLLHADPRAYTSSCHHNTGPSSRSIRKQGKLTNYALHSTPLYSILQLPPLNILPSIYSLQRAQANDVVL